MEARLKFGTWLSCGNPVSVREYEEMSESQKVFKSRLKWCQNNQGQLKMYEIATSHTQKKLRNFWKQYIYKLNSRPRLTVSVEGISNAKGIAEKFQKYFRGTLRK